MPQTSWTRKSTQSTLQAVVLIGSGLLCLLGALFLHLNPLKSPIGLFCFGLGLLLSAVCNPSRLAIAGVLLTLVGAAIFLAYRPLLPYDNALVVLAVGVAWLILAGLSRRGYVGSGAVTPGLLVLLIGLLLYPPTGRAASRLLAPFVLSLWFPGILLLLLGMIYGVVSIWKGRSSQQ